MAIRRENDTPKSVANGTGGGEDHRRAAQHAGEQVATDIGEAARKSAELADKIGHDTASSAKQATEHATKIAQQGIETAATHADQFASSLATAGEVYRDTAEATTEDLRVLMAASTIVASGMRDMQRTMLEIAQENFQRAVRAPQEAMRCRTLSELAEFQRNWMLNNMDQLLNGSRALFRISERVAQDASKPLEDRAVQVGPDAEKSRKSRSRSGERHAPAARSRDQNQPEHRV